MKFTRIISQIGKPQNAAEAVVNRSTKWIAQHFGVSRRTAQRWKAGTQQPTDRGGRRESVIKSANKETRQANAANALRNAQAINAGRVGVVDKSGGKKSKRNLGVVQLDPAARALMQQAADQLETGNEDEAERLMSQAILTSGGKNYGPLEIDDYPPGFHTI
jgi:hypothetical protein